MRYHLSRRADRDTSWGLPVNQEDLAATLMSLSVIIPRGLDRLGVDLPAADRDAFFHIWRVIGHILGVEERINPARFEDGTALVDAVLHRQQRSSEAGTVLTKGVLDFIHECLPGPLFAGVGPNPDPPPRRGSRRRRRLRPAGRPHPARPPVQAQSPLSLGYGKAGDTVPVLAKASNELGLAVFKQGLRLTNKGRRYQWQVPTGLTPTT